MNLRRITRHFPHYFPLLGILVFTVIGLIWFSYDRIFQLVITIAAAVTYIIWGIVHHFLHKDLYLAVVLEYLAVAILGVVVIFSLIINV